MADKGKKFCSFLLSPCYRSFFNDLVVLRTICYIFYPVVLGDVFILYPEPCLT